MNSYHSLIRHDGNTQLFHAVEMSILSQSNDLPFHIHAEGVRGTGKTSIMRAARSLLPPILRIKGCIYNCHPDAPHCPEHSQLSAGEVEAVGVEYVPRPFLEISHSAKIGTVVGSIDIGKLTDKNTPVAAILPGTIPQAHRGIIFIDEINRLADTSPELADVLLDVMGSKPGRIQIEETGLPMIKMPVSVSVWAASNPDEDPGSLAHIRKQLSDRFDATVAMECPRDYEAVYEILDQAIDTRNQLVQHIEVPNIFTTGNLNRLEVQPLVKRLLASIYVDFELESLRAINSLQLAAALSALLTGKQNISITDLMRVVPLVLAHRVDQSTITNILKYLEAIDSGAGTNVNQAEEGDLSLVNKSGYLVSNTPWWKRWLDAIRDCLQATNCHNSARLSDANNQRGGSGNSVLSSQTTVKAPAKRARSIYQLPDDQLITVEEKK
ncbi:hypothetical protein SRRS_08260 [Sporomusa rhizae]|uniref:ATP-binding protein n=1 Tax=Sporomusa rhizae TaxID=357999 RepID=UPI00352A3C07